MAGLAEYGKGDWRSISRNYVLTRTPTQARHMLRFRVSRIEGPHLLTRG